MPEDLRPKIQELYRQLHSAPELSMQEHQTAKLIERELDALGIEHFRCGGTGVVGLLSRGPGPVVAFRADIDALPLAEDSALPYASTAHALLDDGTEVPVMHGCGHDVHTASLIGTAALLVCDTSWSGTVILIFQPGEETGQGAQAMIEDKLWQKVPTPQVIFAQHVEPGLTNTVSLRPGATLSSGDSMHVLVKGRGSHGSAPHNSIDPIVLGAHMIVRLQSIVAREIDPRQTAVVTVGKFAGGLKDNIIPDSAEFTVNVRTHDASVRHKVLSSIRRVILGEAQISGAEEPVIRVTGEFPQCVNDPDATAELREQFINELGFEHVLEAEQGMASEDFGRLPEAINAPSVFWTFGGFDEVGEHMPRNHSPHFAPILEPTLDTGVRLATTAILSVLKQPNN